MRLRRVLRSAVLPAVLATAVSLMSFDTARADGPPPSTEIEKGNAAALLGIVAGPELTQLSDRDFTSAMYRAADDQDKPRPAEPENQKVKQAAIDALLVKNDPPCAPCTTYIKTGMAAAHQADIAIVTERRQQLEKERKAKVDAAKVIGVTEDRYTPELGRSIYDFIVFLDLNTDEHKDIETRKAAREALNGTPEKQWSFLTVEIFTSHKEDVARQIREANDKTEAEKAAAIAEEKKAAAAYQALGIIADDKMRKLDDDDFVRTVYKLAPKDSEVFLAAREAVLSLDDADRTKFIETGAADARQRDIDNELRRRDLERVKQINAIRDTALASRFHPDLVGAADTALAGTSIDREKFLRVGQYQHDIQTIRGISETRDKDVYLTDENGTATLTKWTAAPQPKQTWKVEAGLADPSCLSFQSVTRPGRYIRYVESESTMSRAHVDVAPTDGTDLFRKLATWCPSYDTLAPFTDRASYYGLFVPGSRSDFTEFRVNSVPSPSDWFADAPKPPMPIDRLYNSNADLRAAIGKPIAEAVLDGAGNGYREYERGIIYLRHEGADVRVYPVAGRIYQKYKAMGAHNGGIGLPVGFQESFGPLGSPAGQKQRFSGGAVYDVTNGGVYGIYGDIYRKYLEAGAEGGMLSWPASDSTRLPDGIGVYSTFAGNYGAIYWHPNIGSMLVYGAIRQKWNDLGAERSWLGYPTSDELATPKGRRSNFQGGRIDWSLDGGGGVVYRPTPITPKAVEIRGVESGRCIQVAGAGQDALKDRAATELWDCVGGVKQIWDLVPLGNNIYGLKNRNSGKCLDIDNASVENQALALQFTCHYGQNQQWEFTTDPSGAPYALRGVQSAKVLDARAHGTANATLVQLFADKAETNQRWTLIPH
ncbi:RICIN domain-containing protein [Amycolatopsis sp. cg5]|uniref:RICIN domain-containing protein n=1 Tax=Amycolatopsis sp. cg5 TaxID=3238802 RepID=UPI00352372EC